MNALKKTNKMPFQEFWDYVVGISGVLFKPEQAEFGKYLFANPQGEVEKDQIKKLLLWCPLNITRSLYGNEDDVGYPNLRSFVALASQSWFHGFTSGPQAEKLLSGSAAGTFVVRFSSNSPGQFAIDVSDGKTVHHLKIKPHFMILEVEFSSIAAMVAYYQENTIVMASLKCKLTTGLPRTV